MSLASSTCSSQKSKRAFEYKLSAGHDKAHLDRAIAAFTKVGKELGVLEKLILTPFLASYTAVKINTLVGEALHTQLQ